MIRGLYTAGWSMLANSKMLDVISNNLANANTNAFKKDTVVFESFPSMLAKRINDTGSVANPSGNVGDMELGFDVGEIYTYNKQGQLIQTNNKLDMAIQNSDNAFFTVNVTDAQGNAGNYYTRDGAFVLNPDKQLVTRDGYLVAGENGPITINGEDFKIMDDGSVVQNGEVINKLVIREFSDPTMLKKFGSNLMQAQEGTGDTEFKGTVAQGFVEQSNVNVISEMVSMISVMRAYEANQKILQSLDGTLEKAVNEVGAIR